jgi:3'-phosphoadenosine 5'-phosphosulfate sulfotransferase (PAPS reductase)/FAD synthetase
MAGTYQRVNQKSSFRARRAEAGGGDVSNPWFPWVIFASYGNDSIALIQWMHENKHGPAIVVYTDTGWSAPWWNDRVTKGEEWASSLGFSTDRIQSEGMLSLVERKKAWPRGGGGKYQFCTSELKEKPALVWLDRMDFQKDSDCVVGIRRAESPNRSQFPMWTECSERHGGRDLFAPLVLHTETMRNELIARTPFPVLPYRSKECYPCVNAGKKELRHLDDATMQKIYWLEHKMGINSAGNERVMFSPKRHGGAVGIAAVVEDAKHDMDELFQAVACDGGWCEP